MKDTRLPHLSKTTLQRIVNNYGGSNHKPSITNQNNSGKNLYIRNSGIHNKVQRITKDTRESLSTSSFVIKLANRTESGNVTAEAKRKYGIKTESGDYKYPVFDVKSALNAIKLRNHSDVDPKRVLRHVSRKFGNNPKVKKALENAREEDKDK